MMADSTLRRAVMSSTIPELSDNLSYFWKALIRNNIPQNALARPRYERWS